MSDYRYFFPALILLSAVAIIGATDAWAQASDVVCDKCVDTTDIADKAVTSAKIASFGMKPINIAPKAVIHSKIATFAVRTVNLATHAVRTRTIAPGAVTFAKLAPDAVTSAKILDGTVSETDLAFPTATQGELDSHAANSNAHHTKTVDTDTNTNAATLCAAGQYLDGNGTCLPIPGGTVTSVGSGTGLIGGPIITSGTLSVDVGTAAGKIPQLDGGGLLPVIIIPSGIDAAKVSGGAVSNTEFNSLDGVTSSIQAQLDALPGGTVTNVTASAPLASSGGTTPNISLSPNSLTAAHLAADSVGSSEIAAGAVGSSEVLNDSLFDVDIADEAGAEFAGGNQFLSLSVGVDVTVRSIILTAPTSGVAIVFASGVWRFLSTGNDSARCTITTGTVKDNNNLIEGFDTGQSTPRMAFAGTRGFIVSTGSITFRLVCDAGAGSTAIQDTQLTAIFLPTRY